MIKEKHQLLKMVKTKEKKVKDEKIEVLPFSFSKRITVLYKHHIKFIDQYEEISGYQS